MKTKEIRKYGQQENQYVMTNILDPGASVYNKLDDVEEIAKNACSQAKDAFGETDHIYLEALLNLGLFYAVRKAQFKKAKDSIAKAGNILRNNYTIEEAEMLAEFIAVSILVELEVDYHENETFALDILLTTVPAPFGIKCTDKEYSKIPEVLGQMIKKVPKSSSPVIPFLVSKVCRVIAQQMVKVGFRQEAQKFLSTAFPPLCVAVWGKKSELEAQAAKESSWLIPKEEIDAERKFTLECLVRNLKSIAYKPLPKKVKVPKDLQDAFNLFEKAFQSVEKIIQADLQEQDQLVNPTLLQVQQALDSIITNNSPRTYDQRAKWQYQLQASLGCLSFAYEGPYKADFTDQAIGSLERAMVTLYDNDYSFEKSAGDDELDFLISATRVLISFGYSRRINGHVEENISSVLSYSDSLEFDEKSRPYYWAFGKLMRAIGYQMEKPVFSANPKQVEKVPPEVRMQAALSFVDECMTVFNHKKYPYEWATALLVWTSATRDMIAPETPKNGKEMFYEFLLYGELVFTPVTHAANWCRIQLQKVHLACSCKPNDNLSIESPFQIIDYAQTFLDKTDHPDEWALLELKKAQLLAADSKRATFALKHYNNCLDIFGDKDDRRLEILGAMGLLAFKNGFFEKAIDPLNKAFEFGENRYSSSETLYARRFSISLMEGISKRLAYAYYKTGRLNEAFMAFERGKSILLYETLCIQHADLGKLNKEQRLHTDKLIAKVRELEAGEYGGMTYTENNEELRECRSELKKLLPGYFQKLSLDGSVSAITDNIPANMAVIIPLITEHGSIVFCLTKDSNSLSEKDIIELPGLNNPVIDHWLFEKNKGWFPAYEKRNHAVGSENFENTILDICQASWDSLFKPIYQKLLAMKVSRVAIIPSGGLQFLPVAAIGDRLKDNAGTLYLADKFNFSVIPSIRVLGLLKNSDSIADKVPVAMIAGVSKYENQPPLPNAIQEAKAIAELFKVAPLLDEQVNADQLKERLTKANFIHLACHGSNWAEDAGFETVFTPNDVLRFTNSGVAFKNILQDWDLRHARLITLSACDTGLVDFAKPWDEFEGLSHVLIQAGCRGVVGSLWSVDDESTSILMIRFYENLLQSPDNPSVALSDAQRWLRETTHHELNTRYPLLYKSYADQKNIDKNFKPFAHPFYWAPFIITGI